MSPFIIYALPRSRTFWTSRFLSFGPWKCGHDETRHIRSVDDVKSLLSMPFYGSVETAAAPYWRLIHKLQPDIRTAVIRRPVAEVMESLLATDVQFDRPRLLAELRRLDAKLDQIEARVPGVLSVRYEDLAKEAICSDLMRHCVGESVLPERFRIFDPMNLQCDIGEMMRYIQAHQAQISRASHQAKRQMLVDMGPRKVIDKDDIIIQQESCETWFKDGKRLFEEHSVQLGEAPDGYLKRNWHLMETMDRMGSMQVMTARCNGRMVGYYVCYIGPATDEISLMSALHISIFVSKDFSGLGTKLQRASIEKLRSKGVGEICFRAGVKADGARMGAIYKRAGAECVGEMYRLKLKEA